jgi:hypothetical protein
VGDHEGRSRQGASPCFWAMSQQLALAYLWLDCRIGDLSGPLSSGQSGSVGEFSARHAQAEPREHWSSYCRACPHQEETASTQSANGRASIAVVAAPFGLTAMAASPDIAAPHAADTISRSKTVTGRLTIKARTIMGMKPGPAAAGGGSAQAAAGPAPRPVPSRRRCAPCRTAPPAGEQPAQLAQPAVDPWPTTHPSGPRIPGGHPPDRPCEGAGFPLTHQAISCQVRVATTAGISATAEITGGWEWRAGWGRERASTTAKSPGSSRRPDCRRTRPDAIGSPAPAMRGCPPAGW